MNEENVELKDKKEINNKPKSKPVSIALKVLRITIETIIWIAIIVLVSLLVMSTVSKKSDIAGHRLYVILSGSMEPTIQVKQAIITKQIEEPQVGDIIAFGKDDFITVHRVIEVKSEGNEKLYKTKGDANNAEDKELVKKENIIGKVQFIIPFIGAMILFLQQHLIVLFLAIVVLVMIILIRRLIFQ